MAEAVKFNLFQPSTWFKRSRVITIGPAKDWDKFRALLFPHSKSGVYVSEKTAQTVPAFWRAINIVAEQVASLPFSVYRAGSDGSIQEMRTSPIWRLLQFRPSPKYNSFEFRETIIRQMMLRGECFVHPFRDGTGSIRSFEILPPASDFFERNGQYFYKFPNQILRWDEVLHFKAYSIDGQKAQSPVDILQDTFGLAIAQRDHANGYFRNGARVGGLLAPDNPMNASQFDQVIKFWRQYNTGDTNAGGVGLLPFGMKWQALGDTLEDSMYPEAHKIVMEAIANITGVPLDLLNSTDKASTYASAEQRMKQFVNLTIRSWCKRIEDEMNSKLFPARDRGQTFVRFNIDGLLRADTEARSGYYNTMLQNGVMSRNEVRKMENMNPREGADELLAPLNMGTTQSKDED